MSQAAINILQLTDTHIDTPARRRPERSDTTASFLSVRDAALRETRPIDLVLLTGDLTEHAERESYVWLAEQLAPFNAPVYCLPGNHDDVGVMRSEAANAGWIYGGVHRINGWLLVLLDSCIPNAAAGQLNAQTLEELASALAAHPGTPSLVALHHHPQLIDSAWMDTMSLQNAAAFWSVLDEHPAVRGVVYGHVHQNRDTYRNGVRVMASPSTCVQFAQRSQGFALDNLNPAYRYIQLLGDGELCTDVVRVNQPSAVA